VTIIEKYNHKRGKTKGDSWKGKSEMEGVRRVIEGVMGRGGSGRDRKGRGMGGRVCRKEESEEKRKKEDCSQMEEKEELD